MKSLILTLILSIFSSFSFGQLKNEMKWQKIELSDSIELNKVFSNFINGLENKDQNKIKSNSLLEICCDLCFSTFDSIKFNDNYIISIDTFINQSLSIFLNSPLFKAYEKRGCRFSKKIIPDYYTRNLPNNYGNDLILYEVWIETYLPNEWALGHEGQSHCFQFVKTKNEFKFYGVSSVP